MKKELMDILVCPVCKEKLELTAEKEDGNEVISGYLYCRSGDVKYPIVDTIPNLIPSEEHRQSG